MILDVHFRLFSFTLETATKSPKDRSLQTAYRCSDIIWQWY